jgi:hypothetical protein
LLVAADLEGKYFSVNPAWSATLGWSGAARRRDRCRIAPHF